MSSSSCRFFVALLGIAFSTTAFGQAQTSTQTTVTVDSVTSSQPLRDGIQIQSGPATLRITALRDDILRVRISSSGTLPEDASWAVSAEMRGKSVDVQAAQENSYVGFRTAALDVRVERNPLRLVVRDLAGNVICADAVERPVKFQLGGFSLYKEMPGGEHYFGLGDKTGQFDRRGQAYTLWNTDVGPQESVDPLYKSIPFFLAINGTHSYGLFLDNTWRTWFDFGKQARDVLAFGAEGGPVDYFIFHPDGHVEKVTLGRDVSAGERPVVAVPAGCWKALRLHPGARYALMANALSPEWTPDRVRIGENSAWVKRFSGAARWATPENLRALIGPNWIP